MITVVTRSVEHHRQESTLMIDVVTIASGSIVLIVSFALIAFIILPLEKRSTR